MGIVLKKHVSSHSMALEICVIPPTGTDLPKSYKLLRCLGRGANGEVWEANAAGTKVALKILRGGQFSADRFAKECVLLRRLDHPNIVRVAGLHSNDQFGSMIEMELVDGPSLAAMATDAGGFLTWETLKPLVLQLCEALEHAHESGVVHRDVKPANLLVDRAGKLKLVDFGCALIARNSCHEMAETVELASSGTLCFMSPQQLNGEAPSPSDDIYALGATLHALLAGAAPFATGMIVQQVLRSSPLPLQVHQRKLGVRNPVPAGVSRVIAACLSKKPSERPPSAAVLGQMIERDGVSPTGRRSAIVTLAGCGMGLALLGGAFLRHRHSPIPRLESGFVSMFDGVTLNGWRCNPGIWQVNNGILIGRLSDSRMPDASKWRKETLDWKGDVPDDFELRLQVSLVLPERDAGNLGVRYRTRLSQPPVSYDLDFEPIWQYNCGLREFGGRDMLARPTQIVRLRGAGENRSIELLGHLGDELTLKNAYKENDWNDLVIRAHGHRLRHVLNGVTIIDCADEDESNRRLRGGISLKILLYYGPWIEARFRHIRIRALG